MLTQPHAHEAKSVARFARWLCGLKSPAIDERYPKCLNVPEKYVHKPDPCIFSQGELTTSLEQIKWENPDITLFDGAVPIRSTFGLQENKEYTIEALIRNCSPDVGAHNTTVQLFSAAFGIGSQAVGLTPIPLPQPIVSIPPESGLAIRANWVSPSTSAAFVVRLSHPDDNNIRNNEGWHIVRLDESDPAAGGSPIFPLWNPFGGTRFIKVHIIEESPDRWFPVSEITIGRSDQFLPVGVLPDQAHVISGHLAGLLLDIPDTTPPGILHVSHLTAFALPTLDGPKTLVGGVTYIVRTI